MSNHYSLTRFCHVCQDVLAAGDAVRSVSSGPECLKAVSLRIRAGRWALKRVLRAAFEAVADNVTWHSRDLFW